MWNAPVFTIASTVVFASLVTSGNAAPVGEVVKACDNMNAAGQTCTLGIKDGNLVGCTVQVTFECSPTTRECKGSKNTSGKCNNDGTAARVLLLHGKELLNELQLKK